MVIAANNRVLDPGHVVPIAALDVGLLNRDVISSGTAVGNGPCDGNTRCGAGVVGGGNPKCLLAGGLMLFLGDGAVCEEIVELLELGADIRH